MYRPYLKFPSWTNDVCYSQRDTVVDRDVVNITGLKTSPVLYVAFSYPGPLISSIVEQFLSICLLWPWHLGRVQTCHFAERPSIWICLGFPHGWMWFEFGPDDHRSGVSFSGHLIRRQVFSLLYKLLHNTASMQVSPSSFTLRPPPLWGSQT